MTTWHEDYAQGVRMSDFAAPNTVLVWRPRSIVLDVPPPLSPPAAADRWIAFGILGAVAVGFLSLLMWRVW